MPRSCCRSLDGTPATGAKEPSPALVCYHLSTLVLRQWRVYACHVPKLDCPDCGRGIAMHELETRTVAQTTGFETSYRCPFCRADFEEVKQLM